MRRATSILLAASILAAVPGPVPTDPAVPTGPPAPIPPEQRRRGPRTPPVETNPDGRAARRRRARAKGRRPE